MEQNKIKNSREIYHVNYPRPKGSGFLTAKKRKEGIYEI